MPVARKTVVDVGQVGVYHCIFRWVRNVESYGGLFYRIVGPLESTIGNTPDADFARINEALQAPVEQYDHKPQAELQGDSPAMCHALLYPLYLKARQWIGVGRLHEEILHPLALENLQRQLSQQSFMKASNVIEHYFVRLLHQWGLLEVQWSKDAYFPEPEKIRISSLFGRFIQFDKDAG